MKNIKNWEKFEEGIAYKSDKTKNKRTEVKEDKRDSFRKKVKELVQSHGCKVSKVGNDYEIHYKDKHIAQAMFRNDYIGIKKVGAKFTDEFGYDELGKIKSKLNDIIKSYK